MSMLPAAPNWAGNVRGLRAVGTSLAIGALSLVVANSALAAETAGSILKKMAENYTKAKSYQVSITSVQVGKNPQGKPITVTKTERIQYKFPNLFHKSVKQTGTGAGITATDAAQLASQQGEIYSDGKTATMYVPSKKMYQKKPVPPTVLVAQLVDLLRLVPGADRKDVVLLPTTATVLGRPAYVIEIKPTQPPGLKPDQVKKYNDGLKQFKQFPRFMIDKQNYNLLKYTLATVQGTAEVDLASQVFGAAIPANAFAFAPPAGAKQFTGPPPGAPGSGPGGPNAMPSGGPAPGVGKAK